MPQSNQQGHRRILNKHFEGLKNHLSQQQSRIRANGRLRVSFGIENAFTTPDEQYANQFVKQARKLTSLKAEEWVELAETLRSIAHSLISISAKSERGLHLASLIQSTSLRAILITLLKVQLDTIPDVESHIVLLANRINDVWQTSKTETNLVDFARNDELQAPLSAIFPEYDITDPRKNPLCWILPGFETAWRINLRMLLELQFNAGNDRPKWRETMIAFMRKPTKAQFEDRQTSEVSAKDLVAEALRLYPPTKRIYRAFEWEEDGDTKLDTFAADVEECHLSNEIWGLDALRYNPLRWKTLTDAQKEAYLPFGGAPYECPAKAVFGPRMIGLVVGATLEAMQRKGSWRSSGMDMFRGERLMNDRASYEEMYLRLVTATTHS
ncbi:uncharacterized protein BO97DRAFT_459915 [Aspergillus homomorphus CBS 101889]|uniref:Cytochrome P450 n=1 Tax=Aspergillus homomorphus (strain CBS 101889) TaxID=1450537 RepID=A0A395HLW5_ASPHC|nr:hypothetical protein BO97DRAFT_459915 [Aspergillus homomorphus CBS 101889]RAL08921.1 hypothetical protein BO97DRAFT_459915 [Aspergillus homomorphus CBS 101889]